MFAAIVSQLCRVARPRKAGLRRLSFEGLEERRLFSTTPFRMTIAPLPVVAGTPELVTLTAADDAGAPITTFGDTVTFSTTDPKASLPSKPHAFAAKDLGTYSFLATFKTVATTGTQKLTVTDITANITQDFMIVVTPAAAHGFVVSGLPAAITAGTPAAITVTAIDAYGNTATGYTGTVKFSSTDPAAVLPANYSFSMAKDQGVHTFPVTFATHGSSRSVTVTDAGNALVTGVEKVKVNADPGTLSGLTAVLLPSQAAVAGQFIHVVVAAINQYGDNFAGYAGTVHFSSSDPQAVLPPDTNFAAYASGSHTFSVTFKTAGSQTLTVTDAANRFVATLKFADVSAGAVGKFLVTGLTGAVHGTTELVTVSTFDKYGNPVSAPLIGNQAVTLIITNNKQFVTRYTFVPSDNGQSKFSITLLGPGSDTVSVHDANSGAVHGNETVMVT